MGKFLQTSPRDNIVNASSFDAWVVSMNSLEKSGYCNMGFDIGFCFIVRNALS